MFVVFDNHNTSASLVSSVYWKFQGNLFISLSGNILTFSQSAQFTQFKLKSKILDESSSANLVKLFARAQEEMNNEPLRNLIESVMRLAQVNITDNGNDSDDTLHTYNVYFQSSVVINGKREYPLYILASADTFDHDLISLISKLSLSSSINEKSGLIHDFYSIHSEEFDSKIFNNEQICALLINKEPGLINTELDHESILKFTGLTTEQVENLNLQEYEAIFDEMVKEPTPKGKLNKLVLLHSKLTESSAEPVNADLLLPLLTFVLIKCGKDINEQVKFIERFARECDLSGLNGYILTSTVRDIQRYSGRVGY